MTEQTTIAQALALAFAEAGVKRMYGVPGGGSSLDLIEAAAAHDIPFTLTKTENAAVMMAGALAETRGQPGVAIMTKGPGVANAANGIAYASLDRAPVIVVTDGFTPKQTQYITHQVFDQQAMLAPVVKGHSRLDGDDAAVQMRRLIALACTAPFGPVHIELTSEVAKRPLPGALPAMTPSVSPATSPVAQFTAAFDLLRTARRPVVVLGLEARRHAPDIL
ncbi:MAG: thiamine pyrophosphate-binding protein, partial [Burkholderiaceae bacterium]